MRKVLLVYATAGIGHVKASLAIEDALRHKQDISYEIVDILDYTNPLLKWIYHRLYIMLVKYTPTIWAVIYYSLDIGWVYNCIKHIRTLINRLNARKFIDYICKFRPDVIVSTHFFPSDVLSFLKRKGLINAYLISVITDFKLHSYWVSKEVDLFIVANDILKGQLRKMGIDEEKIKVLGLPIESKFYELIDKDVLYKRLDIDKNLFTVLIASGGFGVGPVERLVRELISEELAMQLLIVCGKNQMLYDDIKKLQKDTNVPMKVYGFVDNMHELMEVADILISKSGGMTVSEALAKELPMIIVLPIPGQEMRNCEFLVEKDAAIREDRPSAIKEKVKEFVDNKDVREAMRLNIRAIRRSNPASNLANLILKL